MLGRVGVSDDVRRAAVAALRFADGGEEVEAVLPAEPVEGDRIYLVAFADTEGDRSWVAVDDGGRPVTSRDRVREAVSIAAMVEVVEEAVAEAPTEREPRIASPRYLDALGAAATGGGVGAAIQGALGAVDELTRDVESNYKLELT
jgi:hypothetical protein